MKAKIEALKARASMGESISYLCFWGHRQKGHKVDQSCLSQWFSASFSIDGEKYKTAEHWMMAEKARLFGDQDARVKVLRADDPGKAKAIGRKVRGFNEKQWSKARYEIVLRGNLAKFGQTERLKTYLLGTGNRVLVEASPSDVIWGVGLRASDPKIRNPHAWRGLNLLGFVLMEIRAQLADVRV